MRLELEQMSSLFTASLLLSFVAIIQECDSMEFHQQEDYGKITQFDVDARYTSLLLKKAETLEMESDGDAARKEQLRKEHFLLIAWNFALSHGDKDAQGTLRDYEQQLQQQKQDPTTMMTGSQQQFDIVKIACTLAQKEAADTQMDLMEKMQNSVKFSREKQKFLKKTMRENPIDIEEAFFKCDELEEYLRNPTALRPAWVGAFFQRVNKSHFDVLITLLEPEWNLDAETRFNWLWTNLKAKLTSTTPAGEEEKEENRRMKEGEDHVEAGSSSAVDKKGKRRIDEMEKENHENRELKEGTQFVQELRKRFLSSIHGPDGEAEMRRLKAHMTEILEPFVVRELEKWYPFLFNFGQMDGKIVEHLYEELTATEVNSGDWIWWEARLSVPMLFGRIYRMLFAKETKWAEGKEEDWRKKMFRKLFDISEKIKQLDIDQPRMAREVKMELWSLLKELSAKVQQSSEIKDSQLGILAEKMKDQEIQKDKILVNAGPMWLEFSVESADNSQHQVNEALWFEHWLWLYKLRDSKTLDTTWHHGVRFRVAELLGGFKTIWAKMEEIRGTGKEAQFAEWVKGNCIEAEEEDRISGVEKLLTPYRTNLSDYRMEVQMEQYFVQLMLENTTSMGIITMGFKTVHKLPDYKQSKWVMDVLIWLLRVDNHFDEAGHKHLVDQWWRARVEVELVHDLLSISKGAGGAVIQKALHTINWMYLLQKGSCSEQANRNDFTEMTNLAEYIQECKQKASELTTSKNRQRSAALLIDEGEMQKSRALSLEKFIVEEEPFYSTILTSSLGIMRYHPKMEENLQTLISHAKYSKVKEIVAKHRFSDENMVKAYKRILNEHHDERRRQALLDLGIYLSKYIIANLKVTYQFKMSPNNSMRRRGEMIYDAAMRVEHEMKELLAKNKEGGEAEVREINVLRAIQMVQDTKRVFNMSGNSQDYNAIKALPFEWVQRWREVYFQEQLNRWTELDFTRFSNLLSHFAELQMFIRQTVGAVHRFDELLGYNEQGVCPHDKPSDRPLQHNEGKGKRWITCIWERFMRYNDGKLGNLRDTEFFNQGRLLAHYNEVLFFSKDERQGELHRLASDLIVGMLSFEQNVMISSKNHSSQMNDFRTKKGEYVRLYARIEYERVLGAIDPRNNPVDTTKIRAFFGTLLVAIHTGKWRQGEAARIVDMYGNQVLEFNEEIRAKYGEQLQSMHDQEIQALLVKKDHPELVDNEMGVLLGNQFFGTRKVESIDFILRHLNSNQRRRLMLGELMGTFRIEWLFSQIGINVKEHNFMVPAPVEGAKEGEEKGVVEKRPIEEQQEKKGEQIGEEFHINDSVNAAGANNDKKSRQINIGSKTTEKKVTWASDMVENDDTSAATATAGSSSSQQLVAMTLGHGNEDVSGSHPHPRQPSANEDNNDDGNDGDKDVELVDDETLLAGQQQQSSSSASKNQRKAKRQNRKKQQQQPQKVAQQTQQVEKQPPLPQQLQQMQILRRQPQQEEEQKPQQVQKQQQEHEEKQKQQQLQLQEQQKAMGSSKTSRKPKGKDKATPLAVPIVVDKPLLAEMPDFDDAKLAALLKHFAVKDFTDDDNVLNRKYEEMYEKFVTNDGTQWEQELHAVLTVGTYLNEIGKKVRALKELRKQNQPSHDRWDPFFRMRQRFARLLDKSGEWKTKADLDRAELELDAILRYLVQLLVNGGKQVVEEEESGNVEEEDRLLVRKQLLWTALARSIVEQPNFGKHWEKTTIVEHNEKEEKRVELNWKFSMLIGFVKEWTGKEGQSMQEVAHEQLQQFKNNFLFPYRNLVEQLEIDEKLHLEYNGTKPSAISSCKLTQNIQLSDEQTQKNKEFSESLARKVGYLELNYIDNQGREKIEQAIGAIERIVKLIWAPKTTLKIGGSYQLGTMTANSEVEAILIASRRVTRRRFFGNFPCQPVGRRCDDDDSLFCKFCQDQHVFNLRRNRRSHIPALHFVYCAHRKHYRLALDKGDQLDRCVHFHIALVSVNGYHAISDQLLEDTRLLINSFATSEEDIYRIDWSDPRAGMIHALSSYQMNKDILAKLTNGTQRKVYRLCFVVLRKWAEVNHIFSSVYGFLNDASLALMLLKIVLRFPTMPNVPQILEQFFAHYSAWPWPMPVQLAELGSSAAVNDRDNRMEFKLGWRADKELRQRHRMFIGEGAAAIQQLIKLQMPVIVPGVPERNVAFNVNPSTMDFVQREMARAHEKIEQIREGKKEWESLLEEEQMFQEKYQHYIVLYCFATRSGLGEQFCQNYVVPQLRLQLIYSVEGKKDIGIERCHVWPQGGNSNQALLPYHLLPEKAVRNLEKAELPLPTKFKWNSFANYWIIGVEQQRPNNVAVDQIHVDMQEKKARINHLLNGNNQGGFVDRFFQDYAKYNKHYYQNELSAMELRWKIANLHLHAEFMEAKELPDWVEFKPFHKEKKSEQENIAVEKVPKTDERMLNEDTVNDVNNHSEFKTLSTKAHPKEMENVAAVSSSTASKFTSGKDAQQIENIASKDGKSSLPRMAVSSSDWLSTNGLLRTSQSTSKLTSAKDKAHPEEIKKAEEESHPTNISSSSPKSKLTPGSGDTNQQIENISSQERKEGEQIKYLPPQRRQGAEFTVHHSKSDSGKMEEKLAEKSHSTISSSASKPKRMENQTDGVASTRKALISSFDWISAQGDQLKASQSESRLTSAKDNHRENIPSKSHG